MLSKDNEQVFPSFCILALSLLRELEGTPQGQIWFECRHHIHHDTVVTTVSQWLLQYGDKDDDECNAKKDGNMMTKTACFLGTLISFFTAFLYAQNLFVMLKVIFELRLSL